MGESAIVIDAGGNVVGEHQEGEEEGWEEKEPGPQARRPVVRHAGLDRKLQLKIQHKMCSLFQAGANRTKRKRQLPKDSYEDTVGTRVLLLVALRLTCHRPRRSFICHPARLSSTLN